MNSKGFKNNVDITQILFKKVKYQYESGIVGEEQYKETLELLFNKIDIAELEYSKVDFILEELKKEVVILDVRETLNVAFALN